MSAGTWAAGGREETTRRKMSEMLAAKMAEIRVDVIALRVAPSKKEKIKKWRRGIYIS